MKIQVLGSGLIPRECGLAPRLEPFEADRTLIATILSTPGLTVRYRNPEDGQMHSITPKNMQYVWDRYSKWDPSKHIKPAPAEPDKTEPEKPVTNEPVKPVESVKPADPVKPAEPSKAAEPVKPTDTVKTGDVKPVEKPAAETKPADQTTNNNDTVKPVTKK